MQSKLFAIQADNLRPEGRLSDLSLVFFLMLRAGDPEQESMYSPEEVALLLKECHFSSNHSQPKGLQE